MPTNVKLPSKSAVPDEKLEKNVKEELNGGRLIKSITFFGDSAIPEDGEVYKSVWEAAKLFAQNGYAIVDGGGPGVMKAATDGAESVNGHTIAVYWQPKLASFFEGKNLANVTDESETFSNYLMRTLGLIEKGDAYVVCQGGTGTVSEFGMVWALAKLYYGCHKPVILYGDFWDELMEAFRKTLNIDEVELGVLYRATTPEQLLEIVQKHEKKIEHCKTKTYSGDEVGFVLRALDAEEAKTVENYNRHASSYHSEHAGKLASQAQLDEFMSYVNPPARILDVGTGPGYDARALSDKYSVVGIEPAERFVEIAKFEAPNVEIIQADIVTHDIGEAIYKGIWSRDSLHHIRGEYLDAVFAKLSAALVSSGILYVIVREGEGEFVEKAKKAYGEVDRFYHLFSPQELIDRTERAGLELVKMDHTKRSHNWLVGVFRKP